jgi:hypothetical protein
MMFKLFVVFILLDATAAAAIPVVPNFQQGTTSSTTTTKTKVNEVINSYQYRTGYEYTASGTNVTPDNALAPMALKTTVHTIDGISSSWVGIDPADKPSWSIEKTGAPFQFVETLQGPGLTQHTVIVRETDIEQLTETTSTFSQ